MSRVAGALPAATKGERETTPLPAENATSLMCTSCAEYLRGLEVNLRAGMTGERAFTSANKREKHYWLCLRLARGVCTSSASNGHPPHQAAKTAEAVAGPTPFMSEESVLMAVFTASRDTCRAVSAAPEAAEGVCVDGDEGRGEEECRGRCLNASLLLALTYARLLLIIERLPPF